MQAERGRLERSSDGEGTGGGTLPASPSLAITKISDLRPYMKNLCCVFIVLEKTLHSEPKTTTGEETRISQCLVADASACILLSLWDTPADSLQPGDIIRLTSGYCTLFKNALVLCSGRYGVLERIGEFTMVFSESLNMSTLNWVTDPQNPKNLIPMRTSTSGSPNFASRDLPDGGVGSPMGQLNKRKG